MQARAPPPSRTLVAFVFSDGRNCDGDANAHAVSSLSLLSRCLSLFFAVRLSLSHLLAHLVLPAVIPVCNLGVMFQAYAPAAPAAEHYLRPMLIHSRPDEQNAPPLRSLVQAISRESMQSLFYASTAAKLFSSLYLHFFASYLFFHR